MIQLSRFLTVWRTVVVRDREIIDATVRPEHHGPSEPLEAALKDWPGTYYWARGDGAGRLVLIRSLAPQRERWWLHLLLFLMSFFTVWMGGALLAGAEVRVTIPFIATEVLRDWIVQLRSGMGLDFAVALMGILLVHELGHYALARRYTINASPPFFLPAPPWINFIGTFGAFIRLRSPVVDRRQLMDVGAAGPWAGFIVALVALTIGMAQSELIADAGRSELVVMLGDARIYLGDSLITRWTRLWLLGEGTVVLSPLAQAGWFGVLITMLNLMPLGQLDGGHVLYALLRDKQRLFGLFAWVALLVLGTEFWGWWFWAGFTLLLGGGRVAHPTVLDRYRSLPRSRSILGWATVLLLLLTFTPRPFVW